MLHSGLITAVLASLALRVSSAAVESAVPSYWFSFGDSYTQTGFDPNAATPTTANPFGNPPYPGWTATGGENWVGYLTTKLNNSLLLTYNYAYGGATTDANLVQPYEPTVLSLTDQVNQFINGVAKNPVSTSANSLYSIWIGINDIGNSWWQSGDRAASLWFKNSDVSARNFLFVNVPCIDRSPLMLAQPPSSQAGEKAVIVGYNAKLAAKVAAFEASHKGVKTYLWDSYTTFSTILDNPTAYGFKDATSYGSGSDIFWGNDYHPGSSAHKFFAQDVDEILANTIW